MATESCAGAYEGTKAKLQRAQSDLEAPTSGELGGDSAADTAGGRGVREFFKNISKFLGLPSSAQSLKKSESSAAKGKKAKGASKGGAPTGKNKQKKNPGKKNKGRVSSFGSSWAPSCPCATRG